MQSVQKDILIFFYLLIHSFSKKIKDDRIPELREQFNKNFTEKYTFSIF